MTIEEFKKIRVGKLVFIPRCGIKGEFMGTQVEKISRKNKTLQVFLGGKKMYSYKYVKAAAHPVTCYVEKYIL